MPTDRRPVTALERRSEPLVRAVDRLPPAVPVVATLALVVVGLLLGSWGALLIGAAILFLAWMLAVVWYRITPSERLLRIATLVLLVGLVVVRAVPR